MLADGVYLGLDEARYFAEKRLGSTDMSRLYLAREGWWWKSIYNPDKVEEAEEAKNFGKALHALVLEGEGAYAERFALIPDKATEKAKHGDKFCDTVTDIINALSARDMHPRANEKKAWLIDYCKTRAPDLVIWDALIEKWEKANKDKIGITAVEDRNLHIMADAVRNHPDVGPLFHYDDGNLPLPEVSILWHDEYDIPRRARLDQMLPQTTIDVKSLQNTSGRPLQFAVGEHVAKLGYHIQMADHHIARRRAYRFITEGKVYDGTPEDQATEATAARFQRLKTWIGRFPSEAPNWDYAWMFFQKPDAKKGLAPIIFPWGEDYGGDLHMRGIRCRREAIETYRRCMALFGPDKPWTRIDPLHTSLEGARVKHRVILPHWIGGDAPVPGEDDDL